jgi:hypothetical protein
MKRELIFRKLSSLLEWDEDRDLAEFPWLRLMSSLKFDSYQDFLAGARFVECLVDWLQQFQTLAERQTAYDFVRQKLLFVSAAEMQHLVALFYLEKIERRLLSIVAARLLIPTHRAWADPRGPQEFRSTLRRTLFIGLSDGARMDAFRRANAGSISNEQIVVYSRINATKWRELLSDLCEDEHDKDAKFQVVYLVDDFTGSGTSLLRKTGGANSWKGKLNNFFKDIEEPLHDEHPTATIREGCLSSDVVVVVHHYLATRKACEQNRDSIEMYRSDLGEAAGKLPQIELSYGYIFEEQFAISGEQYGDFLSLTDRYYDSAVEQKKHNAESGRNDVRRGYAGCALPLVLEHNTPNNSFALIWAESEDRNDNHPMRPLFRRRQRHTDDLEDRP